MRLCRFTPAGLAQFENELAAIASGQAASLSAGLVTSTAFTEEVRGGADVSLEGLGTTRLQAAGYLDGLFSAAGLTDPEEDAALWAWLSVFAFDAVCPRDSKGRRKPGARACYIPSVTDDRHLHRHRLLGPYLIFRAHRDDPYRAMCLLVQPLSRPGQLVDRLAGRHRIVACPAAIEVASRYFRKSDGSIRRDAAGKVDRLSDVLMQLDRTYDIYGMTADALLRMLPDEFVSMKPAGPATRPAISKA